MPRKFQKKNTIEDEDIDDDQITTTFGNKIYFYDKINKKSILNLFIEIQKLTKELIENSYLYSFEPYIELHIHSDGGELYCGISAYDILKKNKIPIYTIIEGEACSAATLIALSGKKRFITKNSMILIHQLRTWFAGKHNELEDEMKTADKLMNSLTNIYSENTTMNPKKLKQLIQREEYLSANESLEYGFVDEII